MASVSVIITTYKRDPQYIDEAVRSAAEQTCPPLEIILVDDNGMGTEFQKRNEERYGQDPRVRYLANRENSGAQFSRNTGILNASGEFVAFLDDDDLWHREKLEKQLAAFTSDRVGMAFCRGWTFRENDLEHLTEYHGKGIFRTNPGHEELLEKDLIGSTTQAVIRKSCFARTGLFDPEMPARQDYEMWLRITRYYEAAGVDEPLFYHRVHGGEQISSDKSKILAAYTTMLRKHRDDFRKHPKGKVHKQKIIANIEMEQGRYLKALKVIASSFAAHPVLALRDYRKKA